MAPECSLVAARPHRRGRRGGGRFRDGRQRSGANGGSGSGWDRRGALEQPRPFLERSGAFRLRLAPFPSCHGGDSHCDKRLSNRPEYRSAGLEAANRNLLMRRGRSSAFGAAAPRGWRRRRCTPCRRAGAQPGAQALRPGGSGIAPSSSSKRSPTLSTPSASHSSSLVIGRLLGCRDFSFSRRSISFFHGVGEQVEDARAEVVVVGCPPQDAADVHETRRDLGRPRAGRALVRRLGRRSSRPVPVDNPHALGEGTLGLDRRA